MSNERLSNERLSNERLSDEELDGLQVALDMASNSLDDETLLIRVSRIDREYLKASTPKVIGPLLAELRTLRAEVDRLKLSEADVDSLMFAHGCLLKQRHSYPQHAELFDASLAVLDRLLAGARR